MNTDIKDAGPCRKCLTVELDVNEVNAAFETIYADITNAAQLPGFRKGHVPRKVLERRFESSIIDDVKTKLFEQGLTQAMQENDFSPLGDPDIKLEDLEVKRGEPFSFTTEIDIRPVFELAEYKGLELTETLEPIGDDEIDSSLERLRYSFANNTEIDTPAEADNLVEGKVVLTIDGEEIFNQDDRAVRLEGTSFFGYEVGDLVKHLGGAKAGDSRTIEFKVSKKDQREEQRGMKAVITFDITKVLKTELPELDDGFAKRLGMDSVQALREQFKRSMEADRKNTARQEMEEQLVDLLIKANQFELPVGVIDRVAKSNLEESKMRMAAMGIPEDKIAADLGDMETHSREMAERGVRRLIIFDAIADREEVKVTPADFQKHLSMLAQSYRMPPEKLLKDIQKRNGLASMQNEIRDIKVTQMLIDGAKIKTQEKQASDQDKKSAAQKEK